MTRTAGAESTPRLVDDRQDDHDEGDDHRPAVFDHLVEGVEAAPGKGEHPVGLGLRVGGS